MNTFYGRLENGSIKTLKNYEVILFMSYSYVNIPWNWILRRKEKPTVALHTMAVNSNVYNFKSKVIDKLSKWAINSLQYAVSSTNFLKDSLTYYGFPKNKITVIPNGVDINRFRPVENSETER